eukprot:g5881.t1
MSFVKAMSTGTAIATGLVGSLAGSFLLTTYIRSLGQDFGGSSTGQPRSTAYDWRDMTKEYLKAQKSNPIRNNDGRELQD